MTCFQPLKAYRSAERGSSGKYGITFKATGALIEGSHLSLPCGRCIGCRIDRSRQWALRCVHESKMHEHNCFVTLTYDDQHVPQSYSIDLRHVQLFMKRLRKHFAPAKIRFYACGEYGDRGLRPHYHLLLFGIDFPDKKLRSHRQKNPVYTSAILQALWPEGSHEISAVNFRSAAYCARYVMKKMGGAKGDAHYNRVSPIDGETYNVKPEFAVMSRRPGLGTTWFEKFKRDAFPSDYLIIDGRKIKPPHFYLNKLDEDEQTPIKRGRKREAVKVKWNSTSERLKVREKVQSVRAKRLFRQLES